MTTQTGDWVGQVLDQRYHVTARLGEGGMGHVLRARDKRLGCDVVLKVPRAEMLADAEFRRRFRDEVAALVKLAHPHIVKVSDFGQHAGVPFAVMQFLQGGSLEDRRPRDPNGTPLPVSPRSLGEWLLPIAEALDFIHKQKYIHRDIKPANILFDAHRNPFLSDFGVAKALAGSSRDRPGMTGVGMVLGTPEYLAPEVILGEPFDGRIDQYALAITIYEMLSGAVPFTGPTGPAVLVKQTTDTARPLHELRAKVPPALSAVLARAMAKKPADRFADCTAFAKAALAALLQPSGPGVGPSTPVRGTVRPAADTPRKTKAATTPMVRELALPSAKKRPKVAPPKSGLLLAASAVGGVLFVGLGVGIWLLTRPGTPKPAPPAIAQTDVEPKPRPVEVPAQPPVVPPPAPVVANPPDPPPAERTEPAPAPAPPMVAPVEWKRFGGNAARITALAISRDGANAISGDAVGTVKYWDLADGREVWSVAHHNGAVSAVALSGKEALSGSSDKTIALWDVAAGKLVKKLDNFEHKTGVTRVFFTTAASFPFSPHKSVRVPAQVPASVSDDNAVWWDAERGTPFLYDWSTTLNGTITNRRWARQSNEPPNPRTRFEHGEYSLAGYGSDVLEIYRGKQAKPIARLSGNGGSIHAMMLSGSGDRAMTWAANGTVTCWDVLGKSPVAGRTWQPGFEVSQITLAPDGMHVLLGTPNGSLQLWKLP